MNKELTIIIPTYNDSLERITKTLQSIVAQKEYDFDKIEVILVDDGSTEIRINWEELIKNYPFLNIKYMRHEENRGPGVARQTALNIATGDYIFFLDCGDELYDAEVLKNFSNHKRIECDIVSSKIYDVDSGNKRRSFLFNNAYIFGIFIKKQYLTENQICFSEILRWEEDAFFEELLRYYRPNVVPTGTIGYTYNDDPDSITRKNKHEYQNEFEGFCAMVVKSILLCDFYKKHKEYEMINKEVCRILVVCYSRFYSRIYISQNISERMSKVLYLLRLLIETIKINVTSQEFLLMLINEMYKKNILYQNKGYKQIPYDKLHDFILLINTYENNFDNYEIEGTNTNIEELFRWLEKQNSK